MKCCIKSDLSLLLVKKYTIKFTVNMHLCHIKRLIEVLHSVNMIVGNIVFEGSYFMINTALITH